ncbi:hypothetical protein OPQ81_004500 [Rhizoctonia solani]|nr:hypothetical protein OPQ81_004500 [Rhizoctonia solani]
MQAFSVYAMQLAGPGFQMFRSGVGHLPVDSTVEPGTYHIANGLTGTVLQVSEHDHAKVVSWQLVTGEEKLEQQWYLERSGGGYVFKNRKHNDLYLSVASTDTHALVTASKYPSTWNFVKIGERYGIKLGEHDKLLDLHFGRQANGTEIHIWPSDGSSKQTWELVRISKPHQEKGAPPHKEQEDNRAEILEKELEQLKGDMAKRDRQIAEHEDTIRQLRADLEAGVSKDLQAKLSKQQTEIASLQAKIDRLEYIMSQRGGATKNLLGGR